MNPQVLIVGAGPTGLSLVAQLLRAGVRVRLIDKKSGPSTTSKALVLQYRASEILACMGVIDRFLAVGATPTAVNIFSRNRLLVRLNVQAPSTEKGQNAFSPKAIIIPQSETERILGDLVCEHGGQIEWNTELMEFRQDTAGVISRIRTTDAEEEVGSNFLVSCEGAHSLIREQAGIGFTGKTYPLAFLLADVELDGPLNHGENYVWLHKNGSFGALPLPTPRTWRLIVDVTKNPPGNEVKLNLIRQLVIERSGQRSLEIEHPTWISEFKIHCRMADRFRTGRVFVAGDAAHVHSPTGGQGIVTGIQDTANLAWKFARVLDGAPFELLDTYEEERKPKAAEVLQETDRATRLLLSPNAVTRMLRDFVALPILRNHWVQKELFVKLAQLDVNYRDCRLSQHEDNWKTKLKAGDRAPDVAFQIGPSGDVTTLFKLLQPMQPIALVGERPAPTLQAALAKENIQTYFVGSAAAKASDELVDVYGDFRRLYGMSGDFFCLIRPDDHIGFFQRPINETRIQDYLNLLSART